MSEPEQLPSPVAATGDDDDDDLLLPPAPARAWLLEQLAALVKARGVGPLVSAPLIEPIPEFFPDPWAGGEPSVVRLAKRLLRYAGIEDHPVKVALVDEGNAPAAVSGGVSFEGLRQGTLEFAVQTAAMRDPLLLVPAMARAVAEAYRRVFRLPTGAGAANGAAAHEAPQQRLVDVTAVYLGFGLLTANAALRMAGSGGGWGRRSTRTRTRLGVLDPQSVGFLLAVQLHARGVTGKERRAVLRKLEANPAAFVRAAEPVLEGLRPTVSEQLGLPPREHWPPAPDLAVLTAPFSAEGEDGEAAPEERKDEDRGVQGMNAGKPVFRVERSKALWLAKMLALPVFLLGMAASRMQVGDMHFPTWETGAAAAVLGVLGLAVGRLLPDRRCSEPKCGQSLDADATVCPRCGGTIMGVIHHPRERLAAEEALARKGAEDREEAEAADTAATEAAAAKASPERIRDAS